MAISISDELREIVQNPNCKKVLATVDKEGVPHAVFKSSININNNGQIEYLELIESSQTNKNMVYSIWNHKKIAINIVYEDRSYQIKGYPVRALITGAEFEKRYRYVKENLRADLSTVWIIDPVEIVDQTFHVRYTEETLAHPILKHLDQLVEEGE